MSDHNVRVNFAADLDKIRNLACSQEEKVLLATALALFYSREPNSDVANQDTAAALLGFPSGMKITGGKDIFVKMTHRDYSFLTFALKDKKFYKHV